MFSTLHPRAWRPYVVPLFSLLGIGVFSSPSLSAVTAKAGMVVAVSQGATAESAGRIRQLALKNPIFVGDVVKTDSTGSVQILFDDDSILAVAEDGEVTINRFVYSGTGDAASKTASVAGKADAENSSSDSGASGAASGASGGASAAETQVGSAGGASGETGASAASGEAGSSSSASGAASGASGGVEGVAGAGGADTGVVVGAASGAAAPSTAEGSPVVGAAAGGAGAVGGAFGGTSGSSAAAPGATNGASSMDAGRDGISLDVAQGTVMFGSGDACRSGCDVATLGGVAGIGGKDTDVARGSAMRGDGVMLAVTASERDRSSVVDVIAVGNGMQVAVTGTGLATQVLSQQSSVKLGGNAAAVSALDTQRLQGQMDKVTAVSTTSSSQVSGTSLMAAIDTGVNAKSLTSGLSSSSGSRVAVSQGLSGSAIKGVSGLANGITGGIANSGLKNQGSGIGIKENLTRNGSGTIGKSGGTIGKGSIVVKR